ncbi:M4 family metallopeptidase [Crenothrix sp.]|uniref:M4 family metallopeptidase n=1 Tax=Crenothrix sp. TaxID=3100433 RepID=UPI00374C97C8
MCQLTHHRHSIFCILPPHMLSSIAKNGSSEQRSAALQTMATDATFRALRMTVQQRGVSNTQYQHATAVEVKKKRTIYDARNVETLPGTIVLTEGSKLTDDITVNEAYEGLGKTFDFFMDVYARNSIDDEGMPLDATVHYGKNYDNAFWNGQRMVFGDGDGQLFNRFTIALDVIGHELAHGVTEDEAQLTYMYQSGALNESMSDVFGSLIKQFSLKQTADKADWLIGAGLLTSNVNGVALRSMQDPGTAYDDPVLGKDPQPAHMQDYVRTNRDNGGVHINSGIPNRAFYLLATQLGGNAWEKAGLIWYETLRNSNLRPNTGFQRFAGLTSRVASKLFGLNSAEQAAVRNAWQQVGINVN